MQTWWLYHGCIKKLAESTGTTAAKKKKKKGGRNEPPHTRKQENSGPTFSSSVKHCSCCPDCKIVLSQAVLFCSLILTFLIAPLTAPLLILCRHWSLAFIQTASNLAPQQYTCQVWSRLDEWSQRKRKNRWTQTHTDFAIYWGDDSVD